MLSSWQTGAWPTLLKATAQSAEGEHLIRRHFKANYEMVFSQAGRAKTLKPFQQVPQGGPVPLPRQPGSFEHPPMASTLVHIINQQKMEQDDQLDMKGPNRGLLKS